MSPVRLWYTWEYLDEIRKIVKVPLLVKGILTADDALLCLEHGVDGVVVSNHGGRSMDYGPSTLEVLPEIVAAVRGRVPVITDSGYRRGTDILKALALGANAVLLGRAPAGRLALLGHRACSGSSRSCSASWSRRRQRPDGRHWRRSMRAS